MANSKDEFKKLGFQVGGFLIIALIAIIVAKRMGYMTAIGHAQAEQDFHNQRLFGRKDV